MNNRLIIPSLFVAGSISFLLIPFLTGPNDDAFRAWNELPQYMLLLAFFYLNYFILVPQLYFRNRYLIYFALIIASMFFIPYLTQLINRPAETPFEPGEFPGDNMRSRPYFFVRINHNLFLFLAVALGSLLLRIHNRWRKSEEEIMTARLSMLREQVNPHFLFNTLNSIYLLAMEKSEDTPQAVLKLSDMMRYVLRDNGHNKVPLVDELQYLENFIALQRMRFGDTLPISYSCIGDPEGKKIAQLILITYVENAFKHGVNAAEDNFINIAIDIDNENRLVMEVKNRIVHVYNDADSSRIGLNNTANRLKLLYPAQHQLKITDQKGIYHVHLEIDLT